jgi:hypothetical protein
MVSGLMLGYGARVADGCNIGAYFSGFVSGSLHGGLWRVAAFAGNVLGHDSAASVRPRSQTRSPDGLLKVTQLVTNRPRL